MFKLIIGFFMGIAAAYYTTPLESPFDKVDFSSMTEVFRDDSHSSNIINAMSPSDIAALNSTTISAKVQTAVSLIGAHNLNEQTSDYAVSLITDIVQQKPELQHFVRLRLKNGITNKEALNIFEQYFSLRG